MLRNWKFWAVVAVVGIGLGIGAGWVTMRVWSNAQAEKLLSDDPKIRHEAIATWGAWVPGSKMQRLAQRPVLMRAVDRRLREASDEALLSFLGKFHFSRYMDSPHMTNMRPALHELLGTKADGPLAFRTDLKYATLAFNYAINGMYAEVEPHLLRMAENADAPFREEILMRAMNLLKHEGESIVAGRLDDADPSVARRAWLGMAFLDPVAGYSGNWRDAPDGVAEATLYATIATSDRPEAVLSQVDADPDLRARFEWVRPFLDRAAEMRRGVRAERGELTPRVRTILDEKFLFKAGAPPPEGSEELWRRSTMFEVIGQLVRGSDDHAAVFRWLFDDHPLPAGLDMSGEQREFAGEVLRAWWALNSDAYVFDESAEVFRRAPAGE